MTPPDSTSALAHAAAPPLTLDAVTGLPDRASFSALTHWHCALAAQTETGLAVLAVIWDQAAAMRATLGRGARRLGRPAARRHLPRRRYAG